MRRKCSALVSVLALFAVALLSLPAHAQEQINPRSGQLLLTVTDLTLQAGPITLKLHRTLLPRSRLQGLFSDRWQSNWESRVVSTPSGVVIDQAPYPIPFTREAGSAEYRSAYGERLLTQADGRFVRMMLNGRSETFDAQGRLIERDYRNGNKTSVRYGANGRIERVDGPRGSFIQFSADGQGRVTHVATSTGAAVRYGYTGGNLTEVQVNGGPILRYAYDARGALTRIDRPRTGAVDIAYDTNQRVVSRHWANGAEERFHYDDKTHAQRRIDPTGAVTITQWSADGRYAQVVEPRGGKIVLAFDAHGRPESTTGPSGQTAKIVYDSRGRPATLQDESGQVTRFEYLGETILKKALIQPDGKQQTFEYDAQRNRIGVKVGAETLTAYTYDPNGNLATVTGRGRPKQTLSYQPNGRFKSVTDALGGTSQLEYDSRGNLIRETNPLGAVTVWSYDSQDRVVSLTDPAGGTRRYNYSPGGNPTSTIDPTGGITQYTFNDRGWPVAETDPVGRVTRYEYNPDGRIKSITDPAGQTSRFEYAQTGNVLRMINPLGAVLTKTYDPSGRLKALSFPSGATAQYDHSADGLHTKFIAPSGRATHYRYDAQRRLVEMIRGVDRVTRYEYTSDGIVAKVTPPSGPVVAYEYDEARNLRAVAEDGQAVVRYEYDGLGRRIKASNANGLEISYRYDANGNLIAWQDNLGARARIEHDGAGRPTAIADSFGNTTQYRYDLSGRLVSIADPLGNAKRLMYSAAGELTGVVEPTNHRAEYQYTSAGYLEKILHSSGGLMTMSYNPIGRPLIVKDPHGKESRRTYDAAGYLLSTTDAKGQTITLAYDHAGRLSQKKLPDGKTVSYRYDSAGNLAEVNDGLFPVYYAYDADNRLIRVEYAAIKRTLTYEYNNRNLLSKFVDSEGGIVRYEYDSVKRPIRIVVPDGQAITMTYDAKDRPTSVAYPNGVKGTWSYDAEGRAISITYTDRKGETIAGWRYRYDDAGNRVETVDAEGRGTRFRYDPSGQLVEEDAGTGNTVRYSYLPGGNRQKRESPGQTDTYRYDQGDRLLQAADEAFTYDANGNLTERRGPNGATRYTYDAENQLVKIVLPGGKEVSFGYSPTGERVWRRDSTGLTYFVTDGLNLLAELDQNLRPKSNYIHALGIDRPLTMVRDKRAYFYHADVVGSVSSLTDSNGQVVASYDYDAFGVIRKKNGTLTNPFALAGREYDDALKIYFNRARYYDPSLGRFLARDPLPGNLFDPLSFNAYAYVQNNPLRYVDPFGTVKTTYVDVSTGNKGLYRPSKGILIYPEGRVTPEVEASVIAHETSHHVDWKVKMANDARAGGPNLDFPWKAREQDAAFKAWIKDHRVVNATEQGALWEEGHTLIEHGVKPNDPLIDETVRMWDLEGGYRGQLKQGLNEYDEWKNKWGQWAENPEGPTPKVRIPEHDAIQKKLDAVKASAGQSLPRKPPPSEGSSSSGEEDLFRKIPGSGGAGAATLEATLTSWVHRGGTLVLIAIMTGKIWTSDDPAGAALDAAEGVSCATVGTVVGSCLLGPPGGFVGGFIGGMLGPAVLDAVSHVLLSGSTLPDPWSVLFPGLPPPTAENIANVLGLGGQDEVPNAGGQPPLDLSDFDARTASRLPRGTPDQTARAGQQGDQVQGGIPGTSRPPGVPTGQTGQPQGDYQAGQQDPGARGPQQPGPEVQIPLCRGRDGVMRPCLPGESPPYDPRSEGVRVPTPGGQPQRGGGTTRGGPVVAQTPPASGAQCSQPLCYQPGQQGCISGPLPNDPGWIPACYANMLSRCNAGEAGATGVTCVRKGADASCAVRARRVCAEMGGNAPVAPVAPGGAACGPAFPCKCAGGAKGHIPCDKSKGKCHCGAG